MFFHNSSTLVRMRATLPRKLSVYSLSMNESTAVCFSCGGTLPGAFPTSMLALINAFEPKAIKGCFASSPYRRIALSRTVL